MDAGGGAKVNGPRMGMLEARTEEVFGAVSSSYVLTRQLGRDRNDSIGAGPCF